MKQIVKMIAAVFMAVFLLIGVSADGIVLIQEDVTCNYEMLFDSGIRIYYVHPAAWCHSCQKEEPYIIDYEPWTDKQHVIRHFCLGCGCDQLGGTAAGIHRWDGGKCWKCGEDE